MTECLLLISCFCASFQHLQVLYQSIIWTANWWKYSLKGICLVKADKVMQVKENIINPYGKTCLELMTITA